MHLPIYYCNINMIVCNNFLGIALHYVMFPCLTFLQVVVVGGEKNHAQNICNTRSQILSLDILLLSNMAQRSWDFAFKLGWPKTGDPTPILNLGIN